MGNLPQGNIETPASDRPKGLTEKAAKIKKEVLGPAYELLRQKPELIAAANKIAATPRAEVKSEELANLKTEFEQFKTTLNSAPQAAFLDKTIEGIA